ncbi:hypothetical protein PCANC_21650 [Puccinia coronata f. sp. avenae]|uniref:CxC1-like cysteine cluster associated with KDZ transposases domain-containing protein n=1 Tax=Puccinia coronata f. sp. avenae TaxID=200324 RepID=A0A2N5SEK9_9BASI|nr:hypothetical protein PCANC_21650 [Puccinia coronata f. sp. avenae]
MPAHRTRALRDDSELDDTSSSRRQFRSSRNQRATQMYHRNEVAQINQSLQIGQQYGMVALPRHPARLPSHIQNEVDHYNLYPDLQDDLPPSSQVALSHARYHRLRWYAEERELRMAEWAKIEDEAAATFFWCQRHTRNWSTHKPPSATVPFTCVCPASLITKRAVDLIDICERHPSFPITFCKCIPEVIRLMYHGYIASSAKVPRTAFSIPLIQLHHQIWQVSTISASGFTKALMSFLDDRHKQPLLGRGSDKSRQLRMPFTHSIDLYSRILILKDALYQEGLSMTSNQRWSEKCPQCFGPREHKQKAHANEPDFIMAMDGNYQQRHYAHASKDSPTDSQYPPSFLPPGKINPHMLAVEATEGNVAEVEDPCAESHKVADDKRDGTTWEKCDDSGLFATACRHDVPLLYANVYKSGEKLYYPIALLANIILDFPESKFGILYDIGCQLETHINKRDLLPEQRADLMFGTSVFHAFVHEWHCQVKYNPRLNNCRSQYFTDGLNEASGEWLRSKLDKATQKTAEAQENLAQLHAMRNPHGTHGKRYTNNFFKDQWDQEQAYHCKTQVSYREKQKKELGRLLCLQEQLETEWSVELLNTSQAIARAATVSKLGTEIAEQRARVGDDILFHDLSVEENDRLLEIWYLKSQIRHKFLAMIQEKRPLLRVCRPGEQTTLGTDGQQKIIESLRKRTKQLHKVLKRYNKKVKQFVCSKPDHVHPREIEYTNLMSLEAEDPFWNDGLFTNKNEPWAVDHNTQNGIRFLATVNRGLEEKRRLGWEVRRAMQWAIERHDNLQSLLTLTSLEPHKRRMAAQAVLHSKFINNYCLQRVWNIPFLQVFDETASQIGDNNIRARWVAQMKYFADEFHGGRASMIPGDLPDIGGDNAGANNIEQRHIEIGDQGADGLHDNKQADDNQGDDDQYMQEMADLLNQNMMEELANEAGQVGD